MGGRNGNAGDYWNESAFSYKFCCLTSTAIFMLGILIPAILVFCIDVPEFTIWSFQVWRLFVSMWGQFPSIMSILSIAFSFMWLHTILKVFLSLCRMPKDPLSIRYFSWSSLTSKFIWSLTWFRYCSHYSSKPKSPQSSLDTAGFQLSLFTNSETLWSTHKPNVDSVVYHS